MKKWEYRTLCFSLLDESKHKEKMQKLGSEGWELVVVYNISIPQTYNTYILEHRLVFKREILPFDKKKQEEKRTKHSSLVLKDLLQEF